MTPRVRNFLVCLITFGVVAIVLHSDIRVLAKPSITIVPLSSLDAPAHPQHHQSSPTPIHAAEPVLATTTAPNMPDFRPRDSTILKQKLTKDALNRRAARRTMQPSAQKIELKQRLHAAKELVNAANNGDETAKETLRDRIAHEPDPRIRSALTTGKIPVVGEDLAEAPDLPLPSAVAEPGVYEGYWQYRHNDCSSNITVDADGRATVETLQQGHSLSDGPECHVRYNAWAWRDAAGNLILDGRGQPVDDLLRPGHTSESWSPDSMIVTPTGLIDTIDDRRNTGSGSSGVRAIN